MGENLKESYYGLNAHIRSKNETTKKMCFLKLLKKKKKNLPHTCKLLALLFLKLNGHNLLVCILHTMRSLDDCLGRGRKSNSIMRSQFNLVKSAASKTRNRVDCSWVFYFLGIFGANALPLTWCILHLDKDNP